MMAENQITLVGRLTADPEMKFTNSGKATVRFSLAVDRTWLNKATGEREKRVSFFTITAWEKLAEHTATSLKKGYRAIVTGVLEQRSWETDDGQKRHVVEVVADAIGPDLRFVTCELHGTTADRAATIPDDEEPF